MTYFFGILLFFMLIIDDGNSSHFRGGTISWKPIHGQTVEFKYKMGWTFNSGPGCTENKIGQYVNNTFIGDKDWKCAQGCGQYTEKVGTAFYYCTAASQTENWEQGENVFQFTFKGNGPFNISYTGAMWMPLDFGNPNGWILQTTVDLRIRDDINSTNSSPITASKPLYTLQFACYHELQLPMFDPDGDLVKCRWSRGEECDSVCHAVPSAVLDEDTCTLKFNASRGGNYKIDGWYAVALTIEDFPRKTIHVGNQTYTPTTPLTTVPLQFLIHLVGKQTPCNWNPEFVSPTPAEGTKISIPAGKKFSLKMYAANLKNINERVTQLSLTRPAGMTFIGPTNDPKRNGVVFWELSWTPTANEQGSHIVCGMAEDNNGHKSGTRCITLMAWDLPDPCAKTQCHGNQTCSRIGSTQKVECVCPPGSKSSGQLCIVEIDECKISPCQHGGTCKDKLIGFDCHCNLGYTGKKCETDIDECSSNPCQHGAKCSDKINAFSCSCALGYTGKRCETDIDDCSSSPCQHGGTCTDKVNRFHCLCSKGYSGQMCETEITTTTRKAVISTKPAMSTTTTTTVQTTLKPTTQLAVKTTQTTQLAKHSKTLSTSTPSMTTTSKPLTTTSRSLTTLAAKKTNQNHLTQSQPPAKQTTTKPPKNTVFHKLVQSTTQQTYIVPSGKTTNKQPTTQQKKTSDHNCFKSKPVVLFIIFLTILLVALAAGAGTLAYMLIKTKNSIKALDKSSDSFDINSEK